jgi:hypothetical protein
VGILKTDLRFDVQFTVFPYAVFPDFFKLSNLFRWFLFLRSFVPILLLQCMYFFLRRFRICIFFLISNVIHILSLHDILNNTTSLCRHWSIQTANSIREDSKLHVKAKVSLQNTHLYEIRNRLRKKYIHCNNKIGTNERKNKNQRNKFDNLKKSGKEIMYMNKNESWSELKNTNNIGKL